MEPARLKPCDLGECEGVCCYDGAWLEEGEEATIDAVVADAPDFFAFLPRPYVVDGEGGGRKTATVPHTFRSRPAHFADTRCAFALPDARCALQVYAEERGLPRWSKKPTACWMHPLRTENGRPAGPPRTPLLDPDAREGYPGFVTTTPCGKHHPDGQPWRVALAGEIAWWKSTRKG